MDGLSYQETKIISDIIYATRSHVSSPDAWPGVLEKIAELVHSDCAAVAFYDEASGDLTHDIVLNISSEFNQAYSSYYHKVDPMQAAAGRAGVLVCRPEDVMSVEEWENSEVYVDLFVPHNYYHFMGGTLGSSVFDPASFHLVRCDKSNPFSDRDLRLVTLLQRHFADAFGRERENLELSHIQDAIDNGLECLSCGVFIFGENRKLMHLNDLAREMSDKFDIRQGLVTTRVESMLSRLASIGVPDYSLEEVLHINGQTYKMVGTVLQGSGNEPCYVVRIVELPGHITMALQELATSSGLSAREMEVCKMLIKGLPNRMIADCLFISELTVKDHLKSIFHKLKISRRGELAAKVLNFG